MAITLNHTIVPVLNREESARFYTKIFGFEYIGEFARFIVVRVNDTLCLDFACETKFEPHHYAFKVSDQEFDEIFQRLEDGDIKYGSGPYESEDMTINHLYGGRGVYFYDANRHLLEMLTTDYEIS